VTAIINPNWYDLNSARAYPFLDSASLTSTSGNFVIPNDLIVDLKLSASASLDPTQFYVSRLRAFGTGVLITFAVSGTDVATAAVPSVSSEEFTAYQVVGLPGHSVGGTVVLGGATAVLAAAVLDYSFTAAATPIIPTLITPGQSGVTSITITDSYGTSKVLTGDVVIAAGANAILSSGGQTVSIGMTSGVVLNPCGNVDPGGLNRTAIRTSNGVGPDANGNLLLVTSGCPSVTPVTNGVVLTDTCAEPCCGSAEITAVATAAQAIDGHLADLANRESQLESTLSSVENWLVQ
jgi:hypothetical protein